MTIRLLDFPEPSRVTGDFFFFSLPFCAVGIGEILGKSPASNSQAEGGKGRYGLKFNPTMKKLDEFILKTLYRRSLPLCVFFRTN